MLVRKRERNDLRKTMEERPERGLGYHIGSAWWTELIMLSIRVPILGIILGFVNRAYGYPFWYGFLSAGIFFSIAAIAFGILNTFITAAVYRNWRENRGDV